MGKISINPRHLQACLEYCGLGIEDLKGPAVSTLEKAMEGKEAFSAKQLQKIADYLGVRQEFLTSNRRENATRLFGTHLLSVKDSMPEPRDSNMLRIVLRAESHRWNRVEFLKNIGAAEKIQTPSYPKIDRKKGLHNNADQVRSWLKLEGGEKIDKLRQHIEANNIIVLRALRYPGDWCVPEDENDTGSKFKGFVLNHQTLPVIFIAKHRTDEEQAFVMMHGLSHLLLHKKSSIDDATSISFFPKNRIEQEWEANMLASHILLQEGALQNIPDRNYSKLTEVEIRDCLRSFCRRHCINTAAVLERLHRAGKMAIADCQRYEKWSKEQMVKKQDGGPPRSCYGDRLRIFGPNHIKEVLKAEEEGLIETKIAMVYLDARTLKRFAKVKKEQK